MELKRAFITIHTLIIVLLITLGVIAVIMFQTMVRLKDSHELRYKSFAIANDLKESSDDLTRFCRTYVLTQDSIWENRYWEVLDIREGRKPRPDGRIISLQDSMRKLGFTAEEFDKLRESEYYSNDLVHTERVAFYAVKGLFDDGTGQFRIERIPDHDFARKILFDKEYNKDKANIMKPIEDFIALLDTRTQEKVVKYQRTSQLLLWVIIGLILIISAISLLSFFNIKNKIMVQLSKLIKSKTIIEENEKLLIEQNNDILTQNEEINAQNEELLAQNDQLEALNISITQNEKVIVALNDSLEKKVELRTGELNRTIEKLNITVSELDRFVYSASHDLSAPLKSIQGIINLTKYDHINLEMEEKLTYIEKSINQLERVIKNLIEFSRNSRMGLKIVRIHFNKLIQECFKELIYLNQSQEIDLINEHSDSQILNTDRLRLKIIINNLLSNSIKYQDSKKKHHFIKTSLKDKGGYWEVSISDNGIGIKEEYTELIFDMFYRATELSNGSGLGLFIVKETVKKMQGKIYCDSSFGEGTTFFVQLPKNKVK